MATKKEIDDWLEETGLTRKDVDEMFEELAGINYAARTMLDLGRSWDRWAMHAIKQIPGHKERFLKRALELERQKKEEEEEVAIEMLEQDFYENNFVELMVKKIDNKEKLSEAELKRLILDHQIGFEVGDTNRWTRNITSTIRYNNRLFSIEWEMALTESQIDIFTYQPCEIKRRCPCIREHINPSPKISKVNL